MKNIFKKLFFSLAIILLLGTLVSKTVSPSPVTATYDDCGEKFTYEKTNDYSDSRVYINFESSNNQIDVSAQTGYKVNKVWLDISNDNQSGYVQHATGPLTDYNPNPGTTINAAKVEVEKTCAPWAVSITESVSCGAGQKTFTGTASYGGDTSTTLLVKINGTTVINSESETTSWSFNYTVAVGTSYTITAAVYDSSDPDVSGQHQDTPKATDTWTFTAASCTPTCADHQYLDSNVCVDKTKVCTDSQANNYDSNVSSTEIADNSVCTYDQVTYCVNGQEVTVAVNQPAPDNSTQGACPEEEITPTPNEEIDCPENQTNQNGICIECDGEGECEVVIGGDDPTPTPTEEVTPTPTEPTTNTGGSGDGLSDGRSDGRSDGLGGQAPAVLGANTMANTGDFGSLISKALFALGLTFTTLASAGHATKKKLS